MVKYSQRLIVEDRATDKRILEKSVAPGAAGEGLLTALLNRYRDGTRYRVYWSTDVSWGRR